MVANLKTRASQEEPHFAWITSIKLMSGLKKLVVCEWSMRSIAKAVITAPIRWMVAAVAWLLVGWWSKVAETGIKYLLHPEHLLWAGSEQVLDTNFAAFVVRSGSRQSSPTLLTVNMSFIKIT